MSTARLRARSRLASYRANIDSNDNIDGSSKALVVYKQANFDHGPRIPVTPEQRMAAARSVAKYNEAHGDSEAAIKYWPLWNTRFWDNWLFETVNNCLAYAMLDRDSIRHRNHKPQPGDRGGCLSGGHSGHRVSCPDLTNKQYKHEPEEIKRRLIRDYCTAEYPEALIFPEERKLEPTVPPLGYYNVVLLVANSNYMYDYHFARQDSNGFWSHKPGSTAVDNVDAKGQLITDPRTASFNYDPKGRGDGYHYKYYCWIWVSSLVPERARIMSDNDKYADPAYINEPQRDYNRKSVNADNVDPPNHTHGA